MDKLSYMKSSWSRLRDWNYLPRSRRHATYQEQPAFVKPDFSHSWYNLAKMHDLRLWTLGFAPSTRFDMARLAEIHHLNKEMWATYSQALWRRFVLGCILFILITRFFKKQLLNQNPNYDSHDPNWRQAPANY
eukprot:NODE_7369_length_459_cov_50.521951_g6536_i0.p1 GENE.NODE_7369_length_459_cov_50.521951_g6536_i0~~NODE_7369_length_459_cov_50.521951_g6536_i0.p1  ORF type:complete len:133 (+),score=36.54 NODE_7369_length_459_cov_50.521951_g6536_i0:35-433(+)